MRTCIDVSTRPEATYWPAIEDGRDEGTEKPCSIDGDGHIDNDADTTSYSKSQVREQERGLDEKHIEYVQKLDDPADLDSVSF